jgi:hypothetical protein
MWLEIQERWEDLIRVVRRGQQPLMGWGHPSQCELATERPERVGTAAVGAAEVGKGRSLNFSFAPMRGWGWDSRSGGLMKLGTWVLRGAELDGLEKYFWMQDQCNI